MTAPADPGPAGGSPVPTVIVIDDHELVSTSVVTTLRARGLDARSVAVGSPDQILRDASDCPVGVILLDLDLGRTPDNEPIDGLDLIPRLIEDGWRIIVVSASTDR